MADDSNLNLGEWLRKLLLEKKIEGLVWQNEVENIFRLPWCNQKKKDWQPSKGDTFILYEWAKHKYGYKDGDKSDLQKWKTNFRCALNKCPSVVRLKKEDTELYKVYQFVLQQPQRTTSTLSSSSYSSQAGMDIGSVSSAASYAISDIVFNESNSFNNVPDLLYQDEDMSLSSNDSNSDNQVISSFDPVDINSANNTDYLQPERELNDDFVLQPKIENCIMIIEASYDVPQRPVMSISIKASTPNLRIFAHSINDEVVSRFESHPNELDIQLPTLESLVDLPSANKSKINDVLKNFQRGINIIYLDNNIWIERKSRVKVFATNGVYWCYEIKRKQHFTDEPIRKKIFDYQTFKKDLDSYIKNNSYHCPKDYVIITVGHPYDLNLPSPMGNILVSIKIHHFQAAHDLKTMSGVDLPPDPMLSAGDSLDHHLEANMNQLSIH